MTTKITTDWHIGVTRNGGTTPATREALRAFLRASLAAQLDDRDHIIAGDLFHDFTIDTSEVIATYHIFRGWLRTYDRTLVVLRGNHDYHLNANKVSSFDLLMTILEAQFPGRIVVVREPTAWGDFVLVPHLPNNDMLALTLQNLQPKGKTVIFHANVDNTFAAESAHSLNVPMEEVNRLAADNLVVFGHEHGFRKLCAGRAVVLGCGAPSSISDCLEGGQKFAMYVDGTDYELECIWEGRYAEMDWRNEKIEETQFLRVTGDASADEAAEVVARVAQIRRVSDAFVVANAVKIDGVAEFEALSEASFDSIKGVDVLGLLLEELDEREQVVVKELLA